MRTPLLVNRYGPVVFSLVIALFLWIYVVGQKEREWTFSVPVQVHVSSTDVAGWSSPEKVSVLLSGPQRLLDRLQSDSLAVRLVLAEIQSGQYTRAVLPSMIDGVPIGVQILRIEPAEVRVDIRPLLELRYRVRPQVRDSADGRFAVVGTVEVQPSHVEMRGPGNVFEDVSEMRTEPLEVSGPVGVHTSIVGLVAPRGAHVMPQTVTLTYTVRDAADSRPAGAIKKSESREGQAP